MKSNFATSEKTMNLRLAIVYSVITLVLCFNGWLLFHYFSNVSQQENRVKSTSDILLDLEALMSATKDAETGARGFIITNNETYLEPYTWSRVDVFNHLNNLKQALKNRPDQILQLNILESVIQKRFDLLERLIQSFRSSGGKIDRNSIPVSEGKIVMDRARGIVDRMAANERTHLDNLSQGVARSKELFYWVLILTTVLSVIVISITFVQIGKNQRNMAEESKNRTLAGIEKEKIAEVAGLLTGDVSLDEVGQKLLEHFSKLFGVLAGRLFLMDGGRLVMASTFAVQDLKISSSKDQYLPSEHSLVKAAFDRKDLWEVTQVPSDYWHVSSSLGDSTPKVITFVPFSFQNRPLGVFELASFAPLEPDQKALLAKLFEPLGVGLNAAQSRAHLHVLLERTQQQSEELQAQQEELRTNNEELEQQARALESQQQALNIKNRELETIKLDLEKKAADLERSSQYKSDFLARMSHELRTPLNGLLILSTLLIENKENNLTEKQKQFAKSIHSAGNDLLMLINDILDLSKIEARKLALRKESFTLESVFESKRMTFGPQMAAKNLQLNTIIPENLRGLTLNTDRQRLEQILRNFLSNAIKFTDRGHIDLKAAFDSSKNIVTLTVQDTGIGIPEEKQKIIFDAFEQADISVSRKYGGTGLGLTISRELAQLLGGEISLTSQEGKGSSFSVSIPLELRMGAQEIPQPAKAKTGHISKQDQKPISQQLATAEPAEDSVDRIRSAVRDALKTSDPNSKTILVVEDDDQFRASVVETVRSSGFAAVEAADGEVALAILNELSPDAILLDIKLPGISGLGILEMIKQMPHLRHIPVHMISALEYQHSALRMGALGYLTKPVTIEKVKSALNRIENLLSKKVRRVLLIEDDERQNKAISELIAGNDLEVVSAKTGQSAVELLRQNIYDCIILDLSLPDVSGFDLLSKLSSLDISLPPIVIYTGKDLSEEEENYLRKYSESIIIKGVRSPERLLDEVNLFLHRVESLLPAEKREMLQHLRSQEKAFEGKTVLLVDDDVRNIFALTSALEAKGLEVLAARNGVEALEKIDETNHIDIILMDIMMPKMDGFEAMRHIRKHKDLRVSQIPIVALTAKAMREDHERCMEAGASDYLPKPVNLDNLTTVLKVWLAPKGFFA